MSYLKRLPVPSEAVGVSVGVAMIVLAVSAVGQIDAAGMWDVGAVMAFTAGFAACFGTWITSEILYNWWRA